MDRALQSYASRAKRIVVVERSCGRNQKFLCGKCMMSCKLLVLLLVWSSHMSLKLTNAADVIVQLNVNRPFNDVNEKFVNFAMKPEELYHALDGDNRRIITRMAALLGESYIKFTNDYEFAMNSEMKLRNPTKIIWKGFNRWARAVNWTMIIPVPYDPENWDPMETLKILNSSYFTGINECVWQLGTDFGASHAEDYVSELSTLNKMVESFKPYVDDWRIMGAEISAGSSAEETRRYIELSKDLNSAFGWTQTNPTALASANEPALQVLLRKKVPVWLTFPQMAKIKNNLYTDETTDGLNWAKTLGDAASTGYDAVFKRITSADLERPNFSYYVSALFKKVMGSRVFPARPLTMFSKTNKLYTHCANTVSGGIAFMIVNMNEQPLQLQLHSLSKITETEVWQYTLTMKKGSMLLNNEKIWYNATLRPEKMHKQPNRAIKLSTPERSVSFWVLPNVNLDHCQFTEVVADQLIKDSSGESQAVTEKRYSSSDKLLKKLIQESSLSNNPLVRAMNRRRRRFILKDKGTKSPQAGWSSIFQPFAELKNDAEAIPEPIAKVLNKREFMAKPAAAPLNPFNWFTNWMENTMTADLPLLKRGPRSIDDNYFGPLFATKDGKTTTAFGKKMTKIKKAEQKQAKVKQLYDMDEFDEEEFFKKLEKFHEPEYPRLPVGDVLLEVITGPDGEEIYDHHAEEHTKKSQARPRSYEQSQEIVSERKPLRLLPTELYESLPPSPFKSPVKKFSGTVGGAINSLLFPESLNKKPSKMKKVLSTDKDIKPAPAPTAFSPVSQLTRDFIRVQKELLQSFGEDNNASTTSSNENVSQKKDDDETEDTTKNSIEEKPPTTENPNANPTTKANPIETPAAPPKNDNADYTLQQILSEHIENFFGDNENEPKDIETNYELTNVDDGLGKYKFEELPWWDLDLLKQKSRNRRALHFAQRDDDNDLHTNLISKDDDDFIPFGSKIPIASEAHFRNRNEPKDSNNNNNKTQLETTKNDKDKESAEHTLVTTFKEKVTNFVDIVARHLSDWYDTFTKHIDAGSSVNSPKRNDNSTKTTTTNNVQ